MPDTSDWTVNDQTPDNPYGKSDDYEGFLAYLGALNRSLTPAIAASPLRINVSELRDHPEFLAAAIGALNQWASVTPLKFEFVYDTPFNATTDWMQVVSPEVGEEDDGSAYSANRYVSIGQRFHDTEPDRASPGGYVFDSFIHEFGHEFGLNHPGLYNYSGPGGVQINYLNNATWIYDRQQYSVMSYFDGIDTGEVTRWSATTPLIADIEAVIRRFFSTVDDNGVRTYQDIQLNTGNNTYGFNAGRTGYTLTSTGLTHDIGFVIHDTGGLDTIDFSGSTSGTVLDLRTGHFSSVNGHHANISIFDGHNADQSGYVIERGIGSAYDDTIIGNAGDNVLVGGAGADRMAGGAGNDVYYVDNANDIVREAANGGSDTVIITSRALRGMTFDNVETVIVVPQPSNPPPVVDTGLPPSVPSDAPIYGDGRANEIDGGSGGDIIYGRGGDDILIGGRDTLASRDINNTIDIADLDDQTETDDGDDWLYGGAGNDLLIGGAGNDRLYGNEGNDTFYGQAGVDVFYGGAGIDTVDYSHESPFQLLVNLNLNIAAGGTASGDQFYSIENLIGSDDRIDRFIGTNAANHFWGQGGGDYFNGGGGNDILDGGRDGDILYGEAGNDLIIGGSGQDYIDGGAGNDTASYEGSNAGVTIDLVAGTGKGGDAEGPVQIVGRGTMIKGEQIENIENLIGSSYGDRLIGDGSVNVLNGGGGDDYLTGGGGRDRLIGGAGNDTADFFNRTTGVVINMAAGLTAGQIWQSIESVSGTGRGDVLIGDNRANTLTGQGGRDVLSGGGGNDILYGDYASAGATPTDPGIGMGGGYVTLDGSATNNSTATALDLTNTFSLVADPDIFDATTVPHSTVDATGNGHGGFYAVTLNAGSILTADIDHIADPDVHDSYIRLLDADGNVVSESDDSAGDPGSVSGRDSMLTYAVAQTGTYYIQVGGWTPDGDPDTGFTDAVPVGSTYELNVSVDFAPSGPPTPGTAATDVLNGGSGNDTLVGGFGNDVLTGGSGADIFRFDTAPGAGNVDTITDFKHGVDTIELSSAVMAALGPVGTLAASAFYASNSGLAGDAADRVLYDIDHGRLYYDADGTGSDARILLARLAPHLSLTNTDFVVI